MRSATISHRFIFCTAALAVAIAALIGTSAARAATLHVNTSPAWTRPTSTSEAASTNTLYVEWNGFTTVAASNAPTGAAYYSGSLTPAPTAGDANSASSGSFLIGGTPGDIYSFSGLIAPRIIVPGYDIAGNVLKVQVQVEDYGAGIDTSLLTVNGVTASSLANYSVVQTYHGDGSVIMGTEVFHNDYVWNFTLPADAASLQLDFGWSAAPSEGLIAAVIDTQSVPAPEPSTIALGAFGGGLLAMWGWRRRSPRTTKS